MSMSNLDSGMAVKASRNVLVVLLLSLGLAGCAGKANRDGTGNSSMNSKGAVSAAEQAALERKVLEEQKAASEEQKAAEAAKRRSLPDQLAEDFDSNRDHQKRGFFDEEEYAFAPGLSDAERIAARVEAARRRAGLTESNEEYASAFAFGPYSRIYQQEGDVSGLVALDAKGHLKGWATAGEVTADGSVFAGGASEKALAKLDAEEGFVGSKGGRRSAANRNRNGAIDVAASKSNVNEDFIPQTLGGALPLVLGVEENGQFDFDNYLLRDEVKERLDKLAKQLEGAEYDRLDILGYSDRIGGVEYNKHLSRKRALAVARYLRDRGVPEYKIMVTGKGQDNPVTKSEDCEGLELEQKISCLQPDRRVEIEASILRTSVELE
jgi:outer membrane protein OmpA-like peptidoglycan-associated protein